MGTKKGEFFIHLKAHNGKQVEGIYEDSIDNESFFS